MVISHSDVSFPEGKVYHRIGTAKLRCLNFTMKPHIFCSIWPPFGAPACLASLDPSTNQSANSQARSPGFHREKERVLIVIPVIYQVLMVFPGFISWFHQQIMVVPVILWESHESFEKFACCHQTCRDISATPSLEKRNSSKWLEGFSWGFHGNELEVPGLVN